MVLNIIILLYYSTKTVHLIRQAYCFGLGAISISGQKV